jgi:hypothetical protein
MAAVLDIPDSHSNYLFMPYQPCPWRDLFTDRAYAPVSNATALEVAEHLERYVAARGWEIPA